MSTTERFDSPRPFPFCPAPIPTEELANIDYVDLTLAQAMHFWWNLENLTITVTAEGHVYGEADTMFATDLPINITLVFGPTPTFTNTPELSGISLGGSFYGTKMYSLMGGVVQTGSLPALANMIVEPPRKRCCSGPSVLTFLGDSNDGGGYFAALGTYELIFSICSSGDPAKPIRLMYSFNFYVFYNPSNAKNVVCSPKRAPSGYGPSPGTPPNSGTITIAGVEFEWIGGHYNYDEGWTYGNSATMTVTSVFFSY